MQAVAYRIINDATKEVVLEGIVRDTEDDIFPSQEANWLLEEFPDLPSQVELHHFKVKGLTLETKSFQITWDEISKLPDAKYWWN